MVSFCFGNAHHLEHTVFVLVLWAQRCCEKLLFSHLLLCARGTYDLAASLSTAFHQLLCWPQAVWDHRKLHYVCLGRLPFFYYHSCLESNLCCTLSQLYPVQKGPALVSPHVWKREFLLKQTLITQHQKSAQHDHHAYQIAYLHVSLITIFILRFLPDLLLWFFLFWFWYILIVLYTFNFTFHQQMFTSQDLVFLKN